MKTLRNFFAVSLKYPKNARAPFITAKSNGLFAKRMVQLAKEEKIPLVENDILASVLSVKEVGAYIPESTWGAVAAIFAFLEGK
jgi:type III secretion system FlhB-like substrate exporter